MGEDLGVAAVFAVVCLLIPSHVIGVTSLGARVHVDHHHIGFGFGLGDELLSCGKIEQVIDVCVRGEVHKGDIGGSVGDKSYLTQESRLGNPGGFESRAGIRDSRLPVVV